MNWQENLEIKLNKLYENKTDLDKFSKLKSNHDRVDFLIENSTYLTQLESFLKADKCLNEKTNHVSNKYRQKGNEFYAKKLNKKAFTNYTRALIYAPSSDNNNIYNKPLFLGYSNRSAVFFDEKLYRECLSDISVIEKIIRNQHFLEEINIKTTYRDELYNLCFKLLNRQINCWILLSAVGELYKLADSTKASENGFYSFLKSNESNQTKINEIIEKIQTFLNSNLEINDSNRSGETDLKNEHKNYIDECVDIVYTKKKGRYCVTTRDVEPGECLFTEKPYCSILLPEFQCYFCEVCFKKLYNDIDETFHYFNIQPCSECPSVIYCSEICKDKASFHKYECKYMEDVMYNLGIAHLAYRIVNTTNFEILTNYASVNLDKVEDLNNYFRAENEGVYEQVYRLLTHEEETHIDDLFKYALTSVLLGKHYMKCLNNFNKTDLKLVSSLVLRHLLQTICNAHAITGLQDENNENLITNDREQVRYATAIYPKVSLLNHSCDSNILSSFKKDTNLIVIKSSRKIGKNEEIYNCYGPHYLKMNLFERRQSLLEQYRFECDCNACLTQLNSFNGQQESNIGLKCIKCKSERVTFSGQAKNVLVTCSSCNTENELADYFLKFDNFKTYLNKLDLSNETSLNLVDKLLKNYKDYLLIDDDFNITINENSKLNSNISALYLTYSNGIDALARQCCNRGNFQKAAGLIQKNVNLLSKIYDKNDKSVVELAHELFKLAEIQCNCNQFKTALNNLNEAIIIAESVYSKDNQILCDFYELKKNIISIL